MSTARLSGRKYMVQKCTPLNNLFLILSEISPAGIPPPGRSLFYILLQKQKPALPEGGNFALRVKK